jgi:hypothetical protein
VGDREIGQQRETQCRGMTAQIIGLFDCRTLLRCLKHFGGGTEKYPRRCNGWCRKNLLRRITRTLVQGQEGRKLAAILNVASPDALCWVNGWPPQKNHKNTFCGKHVLADNRIRHRETFLHFPVSMCYRFWPGLDKFIFERSLGKVRSSQKWVAFFCAVYPAFFVRGLIRVEA